MESYKDSGLHPDIIRGVEALGFETPTPIQKLSIEHLLENKTDLIAFAQTGTGKTAAFSLPILNQLDANVQHVQAIVLAPTRELCLQISKDIASYAKFMDVRVTAVYGGSPITNQIRDLQARPQIVVGTPGRTLDLINRRKLRIEDVQFLVLDEADEMLSMGFQDELDAILANTPEDKQTLCFSATMPDGMKKLTNKYLNDPKEISAGKKNISASNVEHELYVTSPRNTYEAMRRIVDFNPNMYGIVFCRTRRETQSFAEQLVNDGYRAEAIHGDLSQAQRDDVMARFRKKSLSVMVATDVAARGIDVTDLTHVINLNIPDDPEVYVHRSGRTGRAGASGISIVITHGRNMRKVKELERLIGKTFETKEVPSGDEICQIKMRGAIDDLVAMKPQAALDSALLEEALDKLAHLSKAELIEKFLGHETALVLKRYRGAGNINEAARAVKERARREGGGSSRGGSEEGFKTVVVDLGYRQNVNPSRLMGLINDIMEGQKVKIGKIDMDKTFSKIDVEERFADEIATKLTGSTTGSYTVKAYSEESKSGGRPQRSSSFSGGGGSRGGYKGGGDRGGRREGGGGYAGRSEGGRREGGGGYAGRSEGGSSYAGRRSEGGGGYAGRSEGGRREGGGGYAGRSEGDRGARRTEGGGGYAGRSESDRGARRTEGGSAESTDRSSGRTKFKGTSKFKGAPKRK